MSKRELFLPISNPKAYLDRILIEDAKDCSINYLDELILAHQYAVPFENLDVYDFKKQIDISTEKLIEKVISNKRGGYCFELNSLFCNLLNELGFEAYPCLAKVVLGEDFFIPSLHRVTVIKTGSEQYVCDVGLGGSQPCFALKLENGYTKTSKAGIEQTFRMKEKNGWWTIQYLSGNEWVNTSHFLPMKTEEVDFIAPNFYASNSENCTFTQERYVNLKTDTGNKSIFNDTFIRIENHERTETPIADSAELRKLLEEHFGIFVNGETFNIVD